jgi:uncharacterized membrane protein YhiD involved in acid resistance
MFNRSAAPSALPLVMALAILVVAVLTGGYLGGLYSIGTPRPTSLGTPVATDPFSQAAAAAAQVTPPSANDLGQILFRLVLAALIGAMISFRGSRRRNEFQIVHTNMMIAFTGAMMMIIVGSDLARAFGLVGASSIVRYRTPVRDPKALASLFVSMGAGIAVGVGLYELAVVAALLVIFIEFMLERGGRSLSRGWYRPETAYELSIETDTPEETLKAVKHLLDKQRVDHSLTDYDRGKKNENVKMGLDVSLPEDVDREDLTLQILTTGARSVSWRVVKEQ